MIEIKKYRHNNDEVFKITKDLLPFIEETCFNFKCYQKHTVNQVIKCGNPDYMKYLERIIKEYNDETFYNKFNEIIK